MTYYLFLILLLYILQWNRILNSARIWAEACGIPELIHKNKTSLKRYVLCAEHFEDHWFMDPECKTAFIKTKIPIPTIFKNNLKECIARQTNASIDTNISKKESPITNLKDDVIYSAEETKQLNKNLSIKDNKSLCSVALVCENNRIEILQRV